MSIQLARSAELDATRLVTFAVIAGEGCDEQARFGGSRDVARNVGLFAVRSPTPPSPDCRPAYIRAQWPNRGRTRRARARDARSSARCQDGLDHFEHERPIDRGDGQRTSSLQRSSDRLAKPFVSSIVAAALMPVHGEFRFGQRHGYSMHNDRQVPDSFIGHPAWDGAD
jgi:hypothetical protein